MKKNILFFFIFSSFFVINGQNSYLSIDYNSYQVEMKKNYKNLLYAGENQFNNFQVHQIGLGFEKQMGKKFTLKTGLAFRQYDVHFVNSNYLVDSMNGRYKNRVSFEFKSLQVPLILSYTFFENNNIKASFKGGINYYKFYPFLNSTEKKVRIYRNHEITRFDEIDNPFIVNDRFMIETNRVNSYITQLDLAFGFDLDFFINESQTQKIRLGFSTENYLFGNSSVGFDIFDLSGNLVAGTQGKNINTNHHMNTVLQISYLFSIK